MKTLIIFSALCVTGAINLFADDSNNVINQLSDAEMTSNVIISSATSKTNGGIFVFFRNEEGASTAEFGSDRPVRYGFISATNSYCNIFLLRPEYSCIISAKSEAGEPVEPTKLGAIYGIKYSEVKGYDKSKLDMSRRKGEFHPDHERPYVIGAAPHFSGLPRYLPAPEELFVFNKPGKYKMWVELQVFCSQPQSKSINLVKFQPVELSFIKKEKR